MRFFLVYRALRKIQHCNTAPIRNLINIPRHIICTLNCFPLMNDVILMLFMKNTQQLFFLKFSYLRVIYSCSKLM